MDNNNTHKKWTDTPVLDTVINAIDTVSEVPVSMQYCMHNIHVPFYTDSITTLM